MINFIVCDDNKEFLKKVKNIIDKVMINNNIEYKVKMFEDYNNSFFNLVNSNIPNKIYILDIETPTYSGIDASRIIRENDYQSTIIFLTAHDELGYTLLKKEYLFLSFINKFDDYENKLIKSLKIALKQINSKRNLIYNNDGIMYTIPLNDILYIYKDTLERKIIIKTPYIKFSMNKQLNEIKKDLNEEFIYSHRACLVNKERIRIVDFKNRIIRFDNEEEINLLSTLYKKELKNDN